MRPMPLMPPRVRRIALTAHVLLSVGWFGAVAAFLALAIGGLLAKDDLAARAAYLAMDLTATTVIVPLSLAALATGLTQAMGTRWGLFRHYWILLKLLVTLVATLVLLLHLRPIETLADAAATGAPLADLQGLRVQLVANAAAALAALTATTALAVLKPRGLIRASR